MRSHRVANDVHFLSPALLAFSLLAACGGGATTTTPVAPVTAAASLPAAIASGCITPSAQAQTSALPAAGGVTGNVAIGALPGSASTCVGVTLATGADATLLVASSAVTTASQRKTLAGAATAGLAQIDIANAANVQLSLTTITLNVPASVPAGSYPATITTSYDRGDGQNNVTVVNVTVTVSSSGQAVISGLTVGQPLTVINPGQQTLFTIYPAGTVLPSPSATPSASASASATPTAVATSTATATAVPTATPTVAPTVTPSPVPTTAGQIYGTSLTIAPATCYAFGNGPASQTFSATAVTNAAPGTTFIYGWAIGDVFTATIPPPVTTYPGSAAYSNYRFTTSSSIVVNSPAFPIGNEVGSGANLFLVLALPPSGGRLDPTPVTTTAGVQLAARVTIDGGTQTCAPQ